MLLHDMGWELTSVVASEPVKQMHRDYIIHV